MLPYPFKSCWHWIIWNRVLLSLLWNAVRVFLIGTKLVFLLFGVMVVKGLTVSTRTKRIRIHYLITSSQSDVLAVPNWREIIFWNFVENLEFFPLRQTNHWKSNPHGPEWTKRKPTRTCSGSRKSRKKFSLNEIKTFWVAVEHVIIKYRGCNYGHDRNNI